MIHGIIVPHGIRAACNSAAHQLGIDPAGTLTTLSIPLVPVGGDDDAEPTHWGARGIINEPARIWLAENVASFPGAMWWRWNASTRELLASWDGLHLGEQWGWSACLAAVDFKRRIVAPT